MLMVARQRILKKGASISQVQLRGGLVVTPRGQYVNETLFALTLTPLYPHCFSSTSLSFRAIFINHLIYPIWLSVEYLYWPSPGSPFQQENLLLWTHLINI